MNNDHNIWKSQSLSDKFVQSWRIGMPFALEQRNLIAYLVNKDNNFPERILDFGSGGGFLGLELLKRNPDSDITYLDCSDAMLKQLSSELTLVNTGKTKQNVVLADYSKNDWLCAMPEHSQFDAIVCGFSLHYIPDDRKQAVYRDIFDLAAPGSRIIILEHIKPANASEAQLHDDYFIESLYRTFNEIDHSFKERALVEKMYRSRPQQHANLLASLGSHLDWLETVGFIDISVHMNIYQFSIFSAVKPRA